MASEIATAKLTEKPPQKKRHKKPKTRNVISFDQEVVPKSVADLILSEKNVAKVDKANVATSTNEQKSKKPKKPKLKKGSVDDPSTAQTSNNSSEFQRQSHGSSALFEKNPLANDSKAQTKKSTKKVMKEQVTSNASNAVPKTKTDSEIRENVVPKKKRKKLELQESEQTEQSDATLQSGSQTKPKKQQDSIREQKRKKFAKLIGEKKAKAEVILQQKSLNYLSKWKHSRDEWKFEKLRQIWLLHNMYDAIKVPKEFWDILVQYFGNSQGKARTTLIKDAIKIIEEEEGNPDESTSSSIKMERARDIIQNLQE